MRLSICAAAIASLTICQQCLARPSFKEIPSGPSLDGHEDKTEKKPERRPTTKYFWEPGSDEELSHYDRRYFHGVASDEERKDTQSHMVRAYLTFFRENKLDTWIAHGTLLGWWWNGKRLPWDFDLDTQVSEKTLSRLGTDFNQTRYKYTSPDGRVRREYLLDVNPWIMERVRGDGMNVIDARWIDIRNGLYVDITGLSETRPDSHPGVVSCKNYHEYTTEELYPMRETMFEGVIAKVPYSYDKILTDEYQERALVNTNFHGHYWDPKQKEWVKSRERAERDQRAQAKRDREAREKLKERKQIEWEASWP